MSMIYGALLERHAQMVLEEAIHAYDIRRLYEQIDMALQHRDQSAFIHLTNKLKALHAMRQAN